MKQLLYILGIITLIIGLIACPVSVPCDPVPCDTIPYIDTTTYYDTVDVYITITHYDTVISTVVVYDTIISTITVYDTIFVYDTIDYDPPVVIDPIGVFPYGQDTALFSELTFHDEFDGSELDFTKWNDRMHNSWEYNPYPNYEVSDGNLIMWVVTDDNGEFVKRSMDTYGKHWQTYGYFEMRAKMPRGAGVYPAFWLWNHESSTYRPEIDICLQ